MAVPTPTAPTAPRAGRTGIVIDGTEVTIVGVQFCWKSVTAPSMSKLRAYIEDYQAKKAAAERKAKAEPVPCHVLQADGTVKPGLFRGFDGRSGDALVTVDGKKASIRTFQVMRALSDTEIAEHATLLAAVQEAQAECAGYFDLLEVPEPHRTAAYTIDPETLVATVQVRVSGPTRGTDTVVMTVEVPFDAEVEGWKFGERVEDSLHILAWDIARGSSTNVGRTIVDRYTGATIVVTKDTVVGSASRLLTGDWDVERFRGLLEDVKRAEMALASWRQERRFDAP